MICAIIQARMGSQRLPGKSLLKIKGISTVSRVVERLRKSKYIDKIILATSDLERDLPLVKEASNIGIDCFAGDEADVLHRFYAAAKKFNLDTIVRITGDCPLIDPDIVDRHIRLFLDEKIDYVHSGFSFPDGIADCEVFSFEALESAWKHSSDEDREHVTPYIWRNPDKFNLETLENDVDLSKYNLSLDEERQYKAIEQIYDALYAAGEVFHLKEIIAFINKNKELIELVSKIERRCPTNMSNENEGISDE